ncbi:hypothetical protein EBZ80_15765 [bacterium]|nr:hypothetical protein [bacterium]
MSPPRFDASLRYFELSGFEDVTFRMDVGFEAECGRIAVYRVGDRGRLAWLEDTALGNGLSVTRDAMTRNELHKKKPGNDVTLKIGNDQFLFGENQSLNHLEYHFLSGRAHTVNNKTLDLQDLVDRVVAVLNEELAAFATVLGRELSHGRFSRLTTQGEFPYQAGLVSRDSVLLLFNQDRKKTYAFLEQATVGVPCADVGFIVLALLSLVIERTKTTELVRQKAMVSKIWEAVSDATEDRLGFSLLFLLLYQYFSETVYFKSAMFFIRTPLHQILERFSDRRDEIIRFFFYLEEQLREDLQPGDPEGYIRDVLANKWFSWGTNLDMEGDTVLFEFRGLYKVLRKHMILHRSLRDASVLVVSAAEI